MLWNTKLTHLIEPEVIRGKEFLKLGEELLVVEAIDSFHIAGAVVQTPSDLRWKISRYENITITQDLAPNHLKHTGITKIHTLRGELLLYYTMCYLCV